MGRMNMILKLVLVVFVCLIVGMTALTAAYCIPASCINENLLESAELLGQEGLYPHLTSNISSRLDNYTDSLMLHIAGYQITESPLVEAVLVNRYECTDNISPLDSLLADISGTDRNMEIVSYSRYWHGYLVVLKPLLTCFNLAQIRVINRFVQYALIAWLFVLMAKKKLYHYMIPAVLLLGFQRMNTTVLSLQFSNVFYIYVLGLIALLLFYERWKGTEKILAYFTLLGAATAYFDLLTYPLVTYGVTTTLLLVLEKKCTLRDQLRSVISSGLAWLLGFAGMWMGKGVVGSLVTRENIIGDIFASVKIRSVGPEETISLVWTILRNVRMFIDTGFMIAAVIFCVYLFVRILVQISKAKRPSYVWNNLGFALICIAPLCWYVVLKQHSFIHYWFTYREWLITLFSGSVMLVKMYQDGWRAEEKTF